MADHQRSGGHRYDTIGGGYAIKRQADPRIAGLLHRALDNARSVIDVGSGAGSYEPPGRPVVAVEPSLTMIMQRPPGAAPVIQARAEALPVRSDAFDTSLAVLTVHHWTDYRRGLAEMARVASRQVVLTWEPRRFARFWLVADYLPEIAVNELELPTADEVTEVLRPTAVLPVPVPADCTDGFCGAYWRRPEAYLDPDVRGAISALASCRPADVARAMAQLSSDLRTGAWQQRYGGLMGLDELDLGYRLVVASGLRT